MRQLYLICNLITEVYSQGVYSLIQTRPNIASHQPDIKWQQRKRYTWILCKTSLAKSWIDFLTQRSGLEHPCFKPCVCFALSNVHAYPVQCDRVVCFHVNFHICWYYNRGSMAQNYFHSSFGMRKLRLGIYIITELVDHLVQHCLDCTGLYATRSSLIHFASKWQVEGEQLQLTQNKFYLI